MNRLAEWSDARTAALFLKPCTPKHLNEEIGSYLTRESGNTFNQTHARGGGWRYHRDDLERVRAIMDALGCSALKAAQHFRAIKTCHDRQLMEWLLERELRGSLKRDAAQLDIDHQLKRRKRRRQ